MDIQILISFIIASVALTLMPGPDIIFVLTESITKGAKHGIGIALGLVTGLLLHTLAASVGLSIIIKESTVSFTIIKTLGAFYLFYLAYKSFKEKPFSSTEDNHKDGSFSLKKLFLKGLFMNILNPKVSLFFIAFFPKFLFSMQLSISQQFSTLGIIFMIQAFLVFSLVSLFASKLTFLKTNEKNHRNVTLIKMFIYGILGTYILI
jgi:threonine/homoserine/homoserine lactone efflux protein